MAVGRASPFSNGRGRSKKKKSIESAFEFHAALMYSRSLDDYITRFEQDLTQPSSSKQSIYPTANVADGYSSAAPHGSFI